MRLNDILRLLPRSTIHELGYSLVPGTLIIGGAALVRPDLLWSLLALKELSEPAKLGALGIAVLVSGNLCMTVVGGILAVFWAFLFAVVYIAFTREKPITYGRSIIWRRLALKLAGDGISRLQDAGLQIDEFEARMKELVSETDKRAKGDHTITTPESDPVRPAEIPGNIQEIHAKVIAEKLGDALAFATLEIQKEPTDLEWQSVYRILTDYFYRPSPETYYSSMALLSSSVVLGTFHQYWFPSMGFLLIAAVLAFIAGSLGAGAIGIALTNGATGDEVQAAEILRILKPRPNESSRTVSGQ